MEQIANWVQKLRLEQCARRFAESDITYLCDALAEPAPDQARNVRAFAIKQPNGAINYIPLRVFVPETCRDRIRARAVIRSHAGRRGQWHHLVRYLFSRRFCWLPTHLGASASLYRFFAV